jgi:hypothetical protein
VGALGPSRARLPSSRAAQTLWRARDALDVGLRGTEAGMGSGNGSDDVGRSRDGVVGGKKRKAKSQG